MAYYLRGTPTPRATDCEMADFIEYQCLRSFSKCISITEVVDILGIVADNNDDDNDDVLTDSIQDSLSEIDERGVDSGHSYPFSADNNTISLKPDVSEFNTIIYTFLLLATREKENKVADGIDGTSIFEQLCSEVIKNYFGRNSHSFVFGTGAENSMGFKDKVKTLLKTLNIRGYRVRMPDKDTGHHQDGGVDVVAFIPFSDRNKGHFVAFGQCKTGTTWRSSTPPTSFCSDYIEPSVVFNPVIFYMVAESFSDTWEGVERNCSGLLFDRERIMEFLPDKLPQDLLEKIKQWNSAIIAKDNS